jgi:hypothetical protein
VPASSAAAALNVQLGGAAVENAAEQSGGNYQSVMLGVVLALTVLFFAFRCSPRCFRSFRRW